MEYMKRSEMISKLRSFIYDHEDGVTGEFFASTEELLNFMEAAGMRPPLLLNQKYKGPLEGWEPEDA
jgi:hypothetical protein